MRDYRAIVLRLPPKLDDVLQAIAEVKGWARSRVLLDALVVYNLNYLREQEPGVAVQVEALMKTLQQRTTVTENRSGTTTT